MTGKRFEKYIRNDLNTERDEIGTLLFKLDNSKFSGLSFFSESAWVWPKPEKIVMESKPPSHRFDEVITLYGSNPENPKDLCGEVEFWIEDEKYTLVESSIIYVPKGVTHCPLIFHRVERPIFHYIIGQAEKYET